MRHSKKKGVILITGSAGRIGSALAKRLGDEYEIVGFELMKAIYASPNEELVPLDVTSEESVAQAFHHIKTVYGKKIAAVIHLAAYYSFSDQSYTNYKKITVDGTKRLLYHLQHFDVEQFIFSSTMLVHKPNDHKKIKEESKRVGSWSYPRSKIETEEVIHKYRGNIPTVVLRISGVYDDMCHSIPISNQIQRIYEKQLQSHLFPGDLNTGSAFMHMDDLVDVFEIAVKKRKTLPKETTLLIGEEDRMTTNELQNSISQLLWNKDIKTWRIPQAVAWIGAFLLNHIPFVKKPFIKPWMIKFADDNYELDLSKAKKLLRWTPKRSLRKDLPLIIKNMKKNPSAWYHINGLKTSKHKLKHAKEWHRVKKLYTKKKVVPLWQKEKKSKNRHNKAA